MRRYLLPAAVLSFGLIIAQVLFTLIVYASDISLYQHLAALKSAGYLIVPNTRIMQSLKGIEPAFRGGLFFTLTTGAGVSVLSLILLWCMKIHSFLRKCLPVLIFSAGCFFIYKLNSNGFNLSATSVFIIIPAGLAAVFMKLSSSDREKNKLWHPLGHVVALFLILLAWIPHLNADTFISIRDDLLLSNGIGRRINDFYYRYTLYPAEVFKSYDQKLLKTCNLEIKNAALSARIERQLRRKDYLKINSDFPVDLTVRRNSQHLLLLHEGRTMLAITEKAFFADIDGSLKRFSEKCDKNILFRKATLLSLVAGLPIACYILLHAAIMLFLFFIPCPAVRSWTAIILCLLIGISLSLPLYRDLSAQLSSDGVFKALQSPNRRVRIAALKKAWAQKMPVDQCKGLGRIINSAHVPERYWLARCLGYGNTPDTYKMLLRLRDDPHPNVVCMALYSLGKRGKKQAIDAIRHQIKTSPHWYIQWYAYKALKRLKWIQSKSTMPPLF